MRYPILIITALLFFFSPFTTFGQHKTDWEFKLPLDIPLIVSGSFGELRANHFHSGVDFTTQGKTGLPVYAIDYGHVSRIVVSPGGYGKALYIEHPNGYTSVYAHLDHFAPKIETIVTNLQYQKETFAIEHYFEPGEIVVAMQELIAYSGNTGSSGGPHLHFEIRETEQQKPINVHFFDLPVKDDVPPHIEAVCIYPLDANSRVNGKKEPLYLPVVKTQNGYILKNNPSLTASGTIGIGVETLDYFSGSWRKCGVYSIRMLVDNIEWFVSRLDGFLFSQTRYLNSHIDYGRKQLTNRTIQKSFLDVNNNLDIYRVPSDRGRIRMEAGLARSIQYDIRDAAGNRSQLNFTVQGTLSPQPLESSIPFQAMISAKKSYHFEADEFSVDIPANSFYTDVPALFEVKPNNGKGFGQHFQVLDVNIPIHNFMELSMPIPAELLTHKGLTGARINKDNGLVFAGGKRNGDHWIVRTREPGVYCFAIDTIAPAVRLLLSPPNRNYAGREILSIEIKDDFSGISDYRVTIDGQWALFEYDAKNNVLNGFFRNLRIAKGSSHRLEITATDQTGNRQVYKTSFIY